MSAIDPLAATIAGVTIAAARIIIGEALVAWIAATPRAQGVSDAPTGDAAELNRRNEEYWRKLTPAVNLATVSEVQWASAVGVSDHVAAAVAAIVAGAAEAAKKAAHDASVRAQRVWDEVAWATEGLERPLAEVLPPEPVISQDSPGSPGHETKEQALDRFVREVESHDDETLAPLAKLLPRLGDRSVRERLVRIRNCEEWSNPHGILHDHPPSACRALFRELLVSPPVYMEVRGDLVKLAGFRRHAIEFRQIAEAFEHELRVEADGARAAPRRLTFPGLTPEKTEQFRASLDAICAGDVRTRHREGYGERISTVRLIAEHFRTFLNLSRTAAAERFGSAPWSSGIAALGRAALGYKVSTDDVRGALKNWVSD